MPRKPTFGYIPEASNSVVITKDGEEWLSIEWAIDPGTVITPLGAMIAGSLERTFDQFMEGTFLNKHEDIQAYLEELFLGK